jgi:hypothetical protein
MFPSRVFTHQEAPVSHAEELEVTIAALEIQPVDAALVELCRITARQMDATAGAPSTRLAAIYLSLLRNLRKVGPKAERANSLTLLREMRGRPAPSKKAGSRMKAADNAG